MVVTGRAPARDGSSERRAASRHHAHLDRPSRICSLYSDPTGDRVRSAHRHNGVMLNYSGSACELWFLACGVPNPRHTVELGICAVAAW